MIKIAIRNHVKIFNTRDFKTVFMPAYRLIAENLEDPRIEEGLRISHRGLRQMKNSRAIAFCKIIGFVDARQKKEFFMRYIRPMTLKFQERCIC